MTGNTQAVSEPGSQPTSHAGQRPPTPPTSITGGDLPHFVSGNRALPWWGIFFLVVIELTVFSSLISSYFYLRAAVPQWPPDGISPPDLLLPTLNSLFFFLSVVPIALSVRSIKQGNQRRLKLNLSIAFVMGFIFMALKIYEYSDSPYNWATNAYGSIVWTMIGFHTAHVIATLLKVAALWVAASQGIFNEVRHSAIEANALYWYFVVGIWVPLYIVIYWSPRWL